MFFVCTYFWEAFSTSRTNENIETVGNLILSDRRLSISEIDESMRNDKKYVQEILHENFNQRNVFA